MTKLDAVAARVAARNRARSPDLFTRAQAAARLGVSPRTFDAHVAPHVPRVQIGRAVRFDPADLDAFVQASKAPAAQPLAPAEPAFMAPPPIEAPPVPEPAPKRRTARGKPARPIHELERVREVRG